MPSALPASALTNVGPVNTNGLPLASTNVSVKATLVKVTFPVFSTVIVYVSSSPKLAPAGATSLLIATVLTVSILGASGISNGVTSFVGSASLLSPFTPSISFVSSVAGSTTVVVPSDSVPVSDTSVTSSLGSKVSPPGPSDATVAVFSIPPASTSLCNTV